MSPREYQKSKSASLSTRLRRLAPLGCETSKVCLSRIQGLEGRPFLGREFEGWPLSGSRHRNLALLGTRLRMLPFLSHETSKVGPSRLQGVEGYEKSKVGSLSCMRRRRLVPLDQTSKDGPSQDKTSKVGISATLTVGLSRIRGVEGWPLSG